MGYKSVNKGGTPSKLRLKDRVKTPSSMKGTVIGVAEYWNGWEYNVKLDGDSRHFKNRHYKEAQLKKI